MRNDAATLIRFRLLQPGSVSLALGPHQHGHVLRFANREQAIFWQRLAAGSAQPVATSVNYRTT
jgi:hypothetical protein